MKPVTHKDGNIKGYQIGNAIDVHNHITDPESWFLTIRPLKIYGESFCKKTATNEQIKQAIYHKLKAIEIEVTYLINDINNDTD